MREKINKLIQKAVGKFTYVRALAYSFMTAMVVGPGYCVSTGITEIDTAAKGLFKLLFGIAKIGGVFLAGVGIVKLINYVSETMNGGNASPADLGKGIAGVIAGLILFFLQSALKVVGVTVTI